MEAYFFQSIPLPTLKLENTSFGKNAIHLKNLLPMRGFLPSEFFQVAKEKLKIPGIQIMEKGGNPDYRAHIYNSDFIILVIILCIFRLVLLEEQDANKFFFKQ